MSKRKLDAKAFATQKRKRRQWLTFVRMCRYGINNFSRNAWLTIAATAVMTITLLIIFSTIVARQVLVDTVDQVEKKVDMSIYVKTETTDEQAAQVRTELEKLKTVEAVKYVSPADARKDFAASSKADVEALGALNVATNKFPGTFRVTLANIDDTTELEGFVAENHIYKKYSDPNREASFSGSSRVAIDNIARAASFAEKVGLVASVVFIGISSLIIFNTIRMAIFNRKEEIQMMKLIGADSSFIRGPFIVEAVVYGFIAALIATGLGILALLSSKDKLLSYDIAVQPIIDTVTIYSPFVLLAMIVAGALIGVISSILATRKYLKI